MKHETRDGGTRKRKRPAEAGRRSRRLDSGKDELEHGEKDDREEGAGRQGDQSGHEDRTDHAQVQRTDTAGDTNAKHGTHQRMGGGNRQLPHGSQQNG